MSVAYSAQRKMYMPQGIRLAEELPRTPLLGTWVNRALRRLILNPAK
jgi:hypothetical protein